MKQKIKKSKKRSKIKDYDIRLLDFQNNSKTKMVLEFDQCLGCSIKSLAVNKNNVITTTLRYFNSKMLMFAKYMIERIFQYHVLTDMDSTCIMVVFICKLEKRTSVD